MKHAYLIIAHHEFEILKKLVQAIDDERNDIYIHIDKKVKILPFVRTSQSNLMVLTNRVDVRWGDLSQLRAEYALLEAAYKQNRQYAYYHILSGVHLPLYPQKYIHAFFDNLQHKDVLQPMGTSDEEILLKIRRYNLFVRHFQNPNRSLKNIAQFCWKAGIWLQKKLGITRTANKQFVKVSNWCSLTHASVGYLLTKKEKVLKDYKYTLCADEFFIATELTNSPFEPNILYYDHLLSCDFGKNSNPRIYRTEDYESLIHSGCLFARKFSMKDMNIVDKILQYIKSES